MEGLVRNVRWTLTPEARRRSKLGTPANGMGRGVHITSVHAHFTDVLSRELKRPAPVVTDVAMKLLCTYSWPGNVRELRNLIEQAIRRTGGKVTQAAELLGVARDTLRYRMNRPRTD